MAKSLPVVTIGVGLVVASCGGHTVGPTKAIAPAITSVTVTPALGVVDTTRFSLVATATGASEDMMSYDWAFPDGTTAQGKAVTKTFGSDGDLHVVLTVSNSEGTASRGVTVAVATMTGTWRETGGFRQLQAVQVNDTFTGSFVYGLFIFVPATIAISPDSPGKIDAQGNFQVVFPSTRSTAPVMKGHLLSRGVLEYHMDAIGPLSSPQTGRLTRISETP